MPNSFEMLYFSCTLRGILLGLKTYRFHFNGKENDNEVNGDGSQQDYGMRIYNNRLGRFLSVDPLTSKFPELSSYQFASNTPIWAIDLDGLEAYPITRNWNTMDVINFSIYINKEGMRRHQLNERFDCSQLVGTLYASYAAANGLPFSMHMKGSLKEYSSSDKTIGPQWVPSDPEGSKERFAKFVGNNTTTITLKIDGVLISNDQFRPGDVSVKGGHAILSRAPESCEDEIKRSFYFYAIQASGTRNTENVSLPQFLPPIPFKSNGTLFRFKELSNPEIVTIEPRNVEIPNSGGMKIPIKINKVELK